MTYQFLCDYLCHVSKTMMPSKRKYKLTLDNISYKILVEDIRDTFYMGKTQNVHNLITINTSFGEVQIVCRPITKLYHKLEILQS